MTADGALFSWGDAGPGNLGYGGVLRQHIPRRVQGALAGHHITQVRRSLCNAAQICCVTACRCQAADSSWQPWR